MINRLRNQDIPKDFLKNKQLVNLGLVLTSAILLKQPEPPDNIMILKPYFPSKCQLQIYWPNLEPSPLITLQSEA
jgi:hypothetical protein